MCDAEKFLEEANSNCDIQTDDIKVGGVYIAGSSAVSPLCYFPSGKNEALGT